MRHLYEKGTTVTPTEQIAQSASTPKTGRVVLLRGLLRAKGSGAPSRRCAVAVLSALCVLAGGLLFASAPAFAYRTYEVSSSFGSRGSGDGQFIDPTGIALAEVALGNVGDVYVADTGNDRVQWFAPNPATKQYEYAGQFNGEQTPAHSFVPGDVAVDNSTNPLDRSAGDVYVADSGGAGHQVVDKFSATGAYEGQLTGACEKVGEAAPCSGSTLIPFLTGQPYGHVGGVAVDPEGNLFVLFFFGHDVGDVDEFSDDGAFLRTFEYDEGSNGGPDIAVDSGDDVYTNAHNEGSPLAMRKFDPSTGLVTGSFSGSATAVAVDPVNNDVFLDKGSSVEEYGPFGEPLSEPVLTFPSSEKSALSGSDGVAVSGTSTVFATQSNADDVDVFNEVFPPTVAPASVSKNTATNVTLNGVVNPEGRPLTSCEFEYGTTTAYGHIADCSEPDAAEVGGGSGNVSVHASLSGLTHDTVYHYRLLVGNATGASETTDQEFTTRGPRIYGEGASIATSNFALLQAKIDPDESLTTYHFEYDTSPYTTSAPHGTSLPVPSASIGSGTAVVPVSVELQDLQPGVTYYYRVVVESRIAGQLEAFDGPGQSFTALSLASAPPETCPNAQLRAEQPYGLGLPDCRAYEVVSPQEKNDGNVYANAGRASVSGEAVTYQSPASFSGPLGASGESRYISRREPAQDRWSTENISPPVSLRNTNTVVPFEELLFTPELSKGLELSHYVPLAEGEEAGVKNLVLADLASASISYQAVSKGEGDGGEVETTGVSTDLSHVVFAQEFGGKSHVYEWAGGKVSQVSVSPTGTEFNTSAEAGAPNIGASDLVLAGDIWHSVSADGLRAFFTVGENPQEGESSVGQLYVRENPEQPQSPVAGGKCTVSSDACTVEVSASQKTNGSGPNGTDAHGPQPAFYRDASADGERVVFTSREELTNDADTGPADNAANLYEYDLETGVLTDLTAVTGAEQAEDSDGAAVLGVVTAGEEESYVYFVANGVLASDENSNGEKARPGNCKEDGTFEVVEGERTCNLYVAHYNAGKWETKFVAILDGADITSGPTDGDESDWKGYETRGGGDAGPGQHTARVTPDGTTLAFESVRSLTGYDNEQAEPGECESGGEADGSGVPGRCREIYLYDAVTGKLVCASCNPSGALPVGPAEFRAEHGEGFSGNDVYYLPRNLSEDGRRVFFQSADALVTHDSNGLQDVYEWEAEGEGSCGQPGGCILPLSDVAGGHVSSFVDASPSGNDVFITTSDQLVPSDTDTRVDIYDVRVGGGFPVTVAPPVCDNGDSCKPPPSPQPGIFGAPGSANFSGPGNPAPVLAPPPPKSAPKAVKCKKGKKLSKGRCVKVKSRKSAKRSINRKRGK